MLNALACLYYLPQANDCERKNMNRQVPQNNIAHNFSNKNEDAKCGDNEWKNNGRMFKHRYSFPTNTATLNTNVKPCYTIGENNEEEDDMNNVKEE